MTKPSLYEQLGGKDSVTAAVNIFYDKLLADPRVKQFFDKIDMSAQRRKQITFMTYAFGGAPNYSGKSMRDAHKDIVEKQGLNETHFSAVAENLVETLQELNVPNNLIDQVLEIVGSTKADVLNK